MTVPQRPKLMIANVYNLAIELQNFKSDPFIKLHAFFTFLCHYITCVFSLMEEQVFV